MCSCLTTDIKKWCLNEVHKVAQGGGVLEKKPPSRNKLNRHQLHLKPLKKVILRLGAILGLVFYFLLSENDNLKGS